LAPPPVRSGCSLRTLWSQWDLNPCYRLDRSSPPSTTCCTDKARVGKGGCPLSEGIGIMSRQRSGSPGPERLRQGGPFFRHRRREKRPPKRASHSWPGMLRLSNRPHGKEALGSTSCALLNLVGVSGRRWLRVGDLVIRENSDYEISRCYWVDRIGQAVIVGN